MSLATILDRARPAWHARAACRTPRARQLVAAGRADFFPERGRSTGAARTICADCEVRDDCQRAALADGRWLHGVWGGLTKAERHRLLDEGGQA